MNILITQELAGDDPKGLPDRQDMITSGKPRRAAAAGGPGTNCGQH